MNQPDHLNTPRLVADATGTTVWRWDQAEPFGNNPADEDPDSNSVAFDLPLRLPGQRYDEETNLHYNYFRDYDPSLGRYAQSDPLGIEDGINTYVYVANGPLYASDPTGQFKYKNDPNIVRLPSDMESKVSDLETCLGIELVITGGAETSGHQCAKSRHYTGQAVDFGFWSNRKGGIRNRSKDFFCCALKAGFTYGLSEGDHFHLQVIPGCQVRKLPPCPTCN